MKNKGIFFNMSLNNVMGEAQKFFFYELIIYILNDEKFE